MYLIACTAFSKVIIPCLVILKPKYTKLSLAKNNFFALILKAAAFSLFKTISTLIGWSSNLSLLMIKDHQYRLLPIIDY